MRIHNKQCPDVYPVFIAFFELLFQRCYNIFVEALLMISLSSHKLHAGFVSKIELEAAVVGPSGQNCFTRRAQGVS